MSTAALQFQRHPRDRVLLGVAAGVAARLGVDPLFLRLSLAALSLASGLGVVLYLAALGCSLPPAEGAVAPERSRRVTPRHTVGSMLVVDGVLLLARSMGAVPFGPMLVPVTFALAGAAVVWSRSDDDDHAHRAQDTARSSLAGRRTWLRLAIGTTILMVGVAAFLHEADAFHALRSTLLAIVATTSGLLLLLGPWLLRLYNALVDERGERIRSDERAEVSAHLHDSVLQTLALIQRSSSQPEVVALARGQERELRAWMLGRRSTPEEDVRSWLDAMASRVEQQYGIAVDVVVVGDMEVDERIEPLLLAVQEAVVNAGRHSGAPQVSVYVEVAAHEVAAYVRDAGAGFRREDVPMDRRGIAESIEGRMQRAGGTAALHAAPDEGTEIELHLPVEAVR